MNERDVSHLSRDAQQVWVKMRLIAVQERMLAKMNMLQAATVFARQLSFEGTDGKRYVEIDTYLKHLATHVYGVGEDDEETSG